MLPSWGYPAPFPLRNAQPAKVAFQHGEDRVHADRHDRDHDQAGEHQWHVEVELAASIR